ncbi:MAG: aspartyl protease family protein [Thermoanaerobaculia bacterium]
MSAACATAASVSIERLPPGAAALALPVTPFNVEAQLQRGRFLEVERYFAERPAGARGPDAEELSALGRARLARADLPGARQALEGAIGRSLSGPRRAEAEWALAQAYVLGDDFREAAWHAVEAVAAGLSLSPGFIRFLEGLAGAELYAGIAAGARLEAGFETGPYDLIRVPLSVNGRPVLAVLDTGASYCILTRSFARETGLIEISESDAYGLGLHQKPIPLTFGVVQALTLAGSTLQTVPVMVMPDDALSFSTARGPLSIPMVMGLHLLKDFSLEIDYRNRRLTLTRIAPAASRASPEQNLFFARGKVFARVSVDGSAWTLFLLDSGSELTMLTTAGVRRLALRQATGVFPRRVEGIGKSRVSWGKVHRVAVGVAGWRLLFRDMVVAETEEALEDGVLGASALLHFRVRIDFGSMRLELEEPKVVNRES